VKELRCLTFEYVSDELKDPTDQEQRSGNRPEAPHEHRDEEQWD